MPEIITDIENKDADQAVIKSLMRKLKRKEINFYDVPEDLRNNAEIVALERKLGIRKSEQRGYDVINNCFFVMETIVKSSLEERKNKSIFDDFDGYYDFLVGDIYDNSCYYQYDFTEQQIEMYNLDMDRLKKDALIDYTIDDFSLDKILLKEADDYKEKEDKKKILEGWIDKVIACDTFEELQNILGKFEKSQIAENWSYYLEELLISIYICRVPQKAFNVLMDCINKDSDIISGKDMCFYYSPQKVLSAYSFDSHVEQSVKKRRNETAKFIKNLIEGDFSIDFHRAFDVDTHFFYEEVKCFVEDSRHPFCVRKYFETFDEFADYLDNNLSDCDFSKAVLPNVDLSKYIINNNTLFPIDEKLLSYSVEKRYSNEKFEVIQKWVNSNGRVVQLKRKEFDYFFDFVHYLKGDLSDADLILCDGIYNLTDISMLKLSGAKVRSIISDKFQIPYEKYETKKEIISFDLAKKNEEETKPIISNTKEERRFWEEIKDMNKILYVTDIHLLHKFEDCKSEYDMEAIIKETAYNLSQRSGDILLIGGDVSSDFRIFTIFVKYLREEIQKSNRNKKVIFILGNHELWDFPKHSIDEITEIYKKVILDNGMYLIQNSILLNRKFLLPEEY